MAETSNFSIESYSLPSGISYGNLIELSDGVDANYLQYLTNFLTTQQLDLISEDSYNLLNKAYQRSYSGIIPLNSIIKTDNSFSCTELPFLESFMTTFSQKEDNKFIYDANFIHGFLFKSDFFNNKLSSIYNFAIEQNCLITILKKYLNNNYNIPKKFCIYFKFNEWESENAKLFFETIYKVLNNDNQLKNILSNIDFGIYINSEDLEKIPKDSLFINFLKNGQENTKYIKYWIKHLTQLSNLKAITLSNYIKQKSLIKILPNINIWEFQNSLFICFFSKGTAYNQNNHYVEVSNNYMLFPVKNPIITQSYTGGVISKHSSTIHIDYPIDVDTLYPDDILTQDFGLFCPCISMTVIKSEITSAFNQDVPYIILTSDTPVNLPSGYKYYVVMCILHVDKNTKPAVGTHFLFGQRICTSGEWSGGKHFHITCGVSQTKISSDQANFFDTQLRNVSEVKVQPPDAIFWLSDQIIVSNDMIQQQSGVHFKFRSIGNNIQFPEATENPPYSTVGYSTSFELPKYYLVKNELIDGRLSFVSEIQFDDYIEAENAYNELSEEDKELCWVRNEKGKQIYPSSSIYKVFNKNDSSTIVYNSSSFEDTLTWLSTEASPTEKYIVKKQGIIIWSTDETDTLYLVKEDNKKIIASYQDYNQAKNRTDREISNNNQDTTIALYNQEGYKIYPWEWGYVVRSSEKIVGLIQHLYYESILQNNGDFYSLDDPIQIQTYLQNNLSTDDINLFNYLDSDNDKTFYLIKTQKEAGGEEEAIALCKQLGYKFKVYNDNKDYEHPIFEFDPMDFKRTDIIKIATKSKEYRNYSGDQLDIDYYYQITSDPIKNDNNISIIHVINEENKSGIKEDEDGEEILDIDRRMFYPYYSYFDQTKSCYLNKILASVETSENEEVSLIFGKQYIPQCFAEKNILFPEKNFLQVKEIGTNKIYKIAEEDLAIPQIELEESETSEE